VFSIAHSSYVSSGIVWWKNFVNWSTFQQDLRSNNLSMDEAITVARNRPLWRLMSAFGATHP